MFRHRKHNHSEFEHGAKYIKSIVYGGLDGIITTFAVVAGVAGASLSVSIVLIMGFANLVADGISMAAGDYLSTKSEIESHKNKRLWKRLERKQLENFDSIKSPLNNAIATFISFLLFGFIPLFAYVFGTFFSINNQFIMSITLTLASLFILGSLKSKITNMNWIKSGTEMLIIGGLAAIAAYGIGYFLATLV